MNLLDTHALVWAVTAPEKLRERVRDIPAASEVKAMRDFLKWELVLKKGLEPPAVLQPAAWWDRYITRPAVEVLPVRVAHVDRLDSLPGFHKDRFDRMLVAQAIAEDCALISRDSVLARCGAPVVWK